VLISADSHVFEPPALWEERLPAAYRDRGPRLVADGDWYVLAIDGVPPRKLARRGGDGTAGGGGGRDGGDGGAMGFGAGGADVARRIADMDADGVRAEVIYPTFGLFVDLIPDPGLALACARVYNDWLAETFLGAGRRFVPAALVPLGDLDGGVAELARVAEAGFRAALVPTTPPPGRPYNLADYDPLWRTAAEAEIPLSMHTGTGAQPSAERGPGGAVINYTAVGLRSAETLCYLAASGVLERHPDLRVVFVETGAGWFAYCCERMDEAFEEHAAWVKPRLAAPPSHYATRQCFVTLGADRAPLLTREITGVGPLLWASDYPHPEGTFPHSREVVARIFADLTDAERRAVTHDNAARLYRIAS
jgi:predicted TIM-barrel fold metal-dependent hydrolase